MSAPPDKDLLNAIATDLAVDTSFVEKDWRAMRLVALLAGIEHDGLRLAFSGGTSLSKGYGLIQRFSEDLDFKVIMPGADLRPRERGQYQNLVVENIRASGEWTLDDNGIVKRNNSQFMRCMVGYDRTFEPTDALRPELKVELWFYEPALPVEAKALRSFVAEAREEEPEVPRIPCVSPVETAADKLSALTRLVLTRERGSERDDPSMIRHLHDLAALEALADANPEFPGLLHRLLLVEAERGKLAAVTSGPGEYIDQALAILAEDPEYDREYGQFVAAMSYAKEGEELTFAEGVKAAKRLRALLDE